MPVRIEQYTVLKSNYQCGYHHEHRCIQEVFKQAGLQNFIEVSLLTTIPAKADEIAYKKDNDSIIYVYPVVCKASQGEYATSCIAIMWLQSKETKERELAIICSLALKEERQDVIDKIYEMSVSEYKLYYSEKYDFDDIDTYTESIFVSEAYASTFAGIVIYDKTDCAPDNTETANSETL